MHTLTSEQMLAQPQLLLVKAKCGEPVLVVEDGEPLFMAVPMGQHLGAGEVRLELAIGLFEREQISIGIAARIAGLSIGNMIDELGKREIAVVRYDENELKAEIRCLRPPVDRE